jgi:hypothetical protein
MVSKTLPPEYKIVDTGETAEPGYEKWKRDKVERGLKQAEDRNSIISADRIWRELGLER